MAEKQRTRLFLATAGVLGSLLAADVARAEVVSITPSKDNSLFENHPDASSGQGVTLFSGETNYDGSRRMLVAFDVAGQISEGSTINSVSLTMNVSRSGPFANMEDYTLHPLTADWGEAESDSGCCGGMGAPAAEGDATWSHRFFGTTDTWETPGGDFVAIPSGVVAAGGTVVWSSTPAMVADVQSWLNDKDSNFGWIIIGDESVAGAARRFDSKEAETASTRPTLTIDYSPPSIVASGAVPNGASIPGTPLLIGKGSGGTIDLRWDPSCMGNGRDYAIYEGLLGAYYSHLWKTCSSGGLLEQSTTPNAASSYYLVVPTSSGREGSYGTNSGGAQRPVGGSTCLLQAIGDPVCP